MKSAVLASPAGTRLATPALATAAPARPPMRAWDELDGIPPYQVMRFQVIAPIKAARITSASTLSGCTMPLPIVRATLTPNPNARDEVEERRPDDGLRGAEHSGGDDGRDRVGGVVEAVNEVEEQRDGDDENDEGDGLHAGER